MSLGTPGYLSRAFHCILPADITRHVSLICFSDTAQHSLQGLLCPQVTSNVSCGEGQNAQNRDATLNNHIKRTLKMKAGHDGMLGEFFPRSLLSKHFRQPQGDPLTSYSAQSARVASWPSEPLMAPLQTWGSELISGFASPGDRLQSMCSACP